MALNTRLLTDASRGTTLAAIQKVAPQSTLMANPAVAALYDMLTKKGVTLATNVADAASAKQQFTISVNLRDTSRVAFDLALLALASLVEANAKSADDLTGMGFTLFSFTKASKSPPDPPVGALIVSIGKAHGKASVTVPKAGNPGRFAAEGASSPTGPWASLPGTGPAAQADRRERHPAVGALRDDPLRHAERLGYADPGDAALMPDR